MPVKVCRLRRASQSGHSSRRGAILVLAAVVLALGVYTFSLSIDTSQKFLAWKVARSRAEAAALAAVLMLDGTEAGTKQATLAAARTANRNTEQLKLEVLPEGAGVRLRLDGAPPMSATAMQREVAEPVIEPQLQMAAPDGGAFGFGLVRGSLHQAEGDAEVGRVVAVRVHSGFPKQRPLTWIAGRVIASANGSSQIECLGGYLRGTQHGAARAYGYFEAALGSARAGSQ
jgi:hypothetical protein